MRSIQLNGRECAIDRQTIRGLFNHFSSKISCKVDTIEYISKRLCAVKVTVDSIEFVLFNIYMPYDKGYANHDLFEFIDVLNELSDNCNKIASKCFVLGGDFNTDLTSSPFIC